MSLGGGSFFKEQVMKKNYTHIVMIVDKSGSMTPLRKETIENFNKFLNEQQAVKAEATFSLVLFDTEYRFLYTNVDLQKVKPLTMGEYDPSGYTALLDATGAAIDETGSFLKNLKEEERPEKVVIVTITDGEENSSFLYTKEAIKAKVKLQSDVYKWQFVFLGANIDAYAEAGALGYSSSTTANYSANAFGTMSAYAGTSSKLAAFRSNVVNTMEFTDKEKDDIEKPK